MRQPWRGHRAQQPEQEVEEDDPLTKLRKQFDAIPKNEPTRTKPRKTITRAGVARWARQAGHGAGRLAHAAGGLPWPLAGLARAVAGWAGVAAERGAERLAPTPPGAREAQYLAYSLRTLAANPRRIAIRETAAKYADDLVQAIPVGFTVHIKAKEILAVLSEPESKQNTATASELEATAKSLRPGSSGRRACEMAAEAIRVNAHASVFWHGEWTNTFDVRGQLLQEADFWTSYATGSS